MQDLTPETAQILFQVVDTDLVKCPHTARPRTNSIHTNHRPRRERAKALGSRGLARLGSVLLFCDDCFLRPLIIPIPYPDWFFLLLIGSAALTSIGPLPKSRLMSWARAVGRPGESPACLGFGGRRWWLCRRKKSGAGGGSGGDPARVMVQVLRAGAELPR